MMETWKSIKGYEGIYEVSDSGKVRGVEGRVTFSARHGVRRWSVKELKGRYDKKGYRRINLFKDKKSKTFLVHRLVALEFLENPNGFKIVNHMDGNPKNNNVKNLEWCNSERNVNHAFDNNLMVTSKEIILTNKNTGEILSFRSMAKASEFFKKNHGFVSSLLKKGKTEFNEWIIHGKEELL